MNVVRARVLKLVVFLGLSGLAACGDARRDQSGELLNWSRSGNTNEVRRVMFYLPGTIDPQSFSSSCSATTGDAYRHCILLAWTRSFASTYGSSMTAVQPVRSAGLIIDKPLWHWISHGFAVTVNPAGLAQTLKSVPYTELFWRRANLSTPSQDPTPNVTLGPVPAYGESLLKTPFLSLVPVYDRSGSEETALTEGCNGQEPPSAPACDALGCKWGWDQGLNGRGSRAAVVDTGLSQGLINSGSPIENLKRIGDIDIQELPPQIRVQLSQQSDASGTESTPAEADPFHGSEVASLIAAHTYGAAPKATVTVLRGCCAGLPDEFEEQVLMALEHALTIEPHAINLSMGWLDTAEDTEDWWHRILTGAAALDTALFVSAGNEGLEQKHDVRVPGRFETAYMLTVGSGYESSGQWARAGFSSYNAQKPDVVAPGCFLPTTIGPSGTRSFSGTSASTPVALGIFAQLKQRFPTLGAPELLQAMKSTSTGSNRYSVGIGFGAPQLQQAVEALTRSHP